MKQLQDERTQLIAERDALRRKLASVLGHQEGDETLAGGPDHEQFLSNFSHELRTPLNAILGWASLLRGNQLSEPSRARALATIERNALALAKLVDDTLDVSHIVEGNLRMQYRSVELPALIEAARDSLREAASAKRIRIELELDPGAGTVHADPDRLEQVFWNLLSNAIKFTPVRGKIEVRLDRPSDERVRLIVKDTGKGIGPTFLPHLFERFTQEDPGTRRARGGLGLGLAIVRHLVELHGGTVSAESPGEGCGSTFTVLLPSNPEEKRHPPAAPVGMSRVLEGVRVLLVDDEADARELLTAVLERSGAVVTSASSADEALAVLENLRPDVLVSDIGMPGKDGYDLIREARALGPERGGALPAGALTAYGGDRDSRLAHEAGFHLHVPKPVTPSELVSMVARLRAMGAELEALGG